MEVSVLSDKLSEYFLDKHFLQSFKNVRAEFNQSVPNAGFHQAAMPDELAKFLNFYFLNIVKNLNSTLSLPDIRSSEFSSLFKCIFYYFWKYVLRFQEIYWLKNYDFNIAEEIYYSNSCLNLNEIASNQKAFILLNITKDELILNSIYTLEPESFALFLNSTFTYFNFTEDQHYLLIPLY